MKVQEIHIYHYTNGSEGECFFFFLKVKGMGEREST